MVVVKKFKGYLGICIDFKDLNKVLKCSYYLLFIIEDILLDFSCVKVFSKFDVNNGFCYIEFDEESLKLIIFNMFFGRYCWLWLFFGFFFFDFLLKCFLEGIVNYGYFLVFFLF